jgi:hypothetical protein
MYLLYADQEADRVLVARLRAGDWSALDVLYGRFPAGLPALLANSS